MLIAVIAPEAGRAQTRRRRASAGIAGLTRENIPMRGLGRDSHVTKILNSFSSGIKNDMGFKLSELNLAKVQKTIFIESFKLACFKPIRTGLQFLAHDLLLTSITAVVLNHLPMNFQKSW